MTRLIIIDYGSGNLRSAAKACERALLDHDIKGEVVVSNNPAELATASHILLPGVGAFGDCMAGLSAVPGMLEALETQVRQQQKWFLGICVGMQLLFDKGYEHGTYDGLGWIGGEVRKFALEDKTLKIPHMGWNELLIPSSAREEGCLFAHIDNGAHAYFVHSYHAEQVVAEHVLATADYGGEFVAAVKKGNIFGTQFHPEKSQANGVQLLANFLSL